MDDIYFSDKRRRNSTSGKSHSPKERFTHSDSYSMQEIPDLKKRHSAGSIPEKKDGFSVRLPDDPFDDYREGAPKNRTPQGAKKASSGSAQPSRAPSAARNSSSDKAHTPSRTPTGSRVPSRRPDEYTPAVRKAQDKGYVPAHARTPQKPPVNPSKKNVKSKIILAVSAVFILLFVGIIGYGYYAMGNIDYDDSIVENAYIDESELASSPDVENILIIGSDERAEDNPEAELVSGQRADTMILFSIDKKNKQIKLTSFLRDSYVYIPSEGYEDKLNSAYRFGGAQLTMDTIEYNFGVKIDRYLTVNFEVFKQFINLLGGIPVEVSEYEAEYMVDELKYIYIKPGVNVMNGNASLMYCRMRYLDNDLYRTQRQRKVIKAVIGKAAKTNLFKLMDIVRQVVPNIRTDISRNELISLGAGAAVKFLHYDIVQMQIPAAGTWWDESIDGIGDVIVFNAESNAEALKEFVFEKHVEEKEEN